MSELKTPATAQEVTLAAIERQRLLKPFSADRPWDEALFCIEIRTLNQIVHEAFYEAGCRLIVAKNNMSAGQWLPFLDNCGLNRFTAAQYMRIARDLADKPRLLQLKAGLTKTEILLQADPDDLDDFEKSGELLGMKEGEILTKSRKELKEIILDKDHRLDQAKKQVKGLQEEIDKLKGDPDRPREAYYDDLHDFRRDVFARLEALQTEALGSGDNRKVIALYNLVNQFKLNTVQRLADIEEQSRLGSLLQGTGHGYDAPYLQRTNLGELAEEEAATICPEQEAEFVSTN